MSRPSSPDMQGWYPPLPTVGDNFAAWPGQASSVLRDFSTNLGAHYTQTGRVPFGAPSRKTTHIISQNTVEPPYNELDWQENRKEIAANPSELFHSQVDDFDLTDFQTSSRHPPNLLSQNTLPSQSFNYPVTTSTLGSIDPVLLEHPTLGHPEASQSDQPKLNATRVPVKPDASNLNDAGPHADALYHVNLPNDHDYLQLPLQGAFPERNQFLFFPENASFSVNSSDRPVSLEHLPLVTSPPKGSNPLPENHNYGAKDLYLPNQGLPSHYEFSFTMPFGQFGAQPQQYASDNLFVFEAPGLAQELVPYPPAPAVYHQFVELENVDDYGKPRTRESGPAQQRTAKGKAHAAPIPIPAIDPGKENINPYTGISIIIPPTASSSTLPPPTTSTGTIPLHACPFCFAMVPGTRNAVRKHLFQEHFVDKNRQKHTLCPCGKSLKIDSLAQHIMSAQHWGASTCMCAQCGKEFARGYLLAAHTKTCTGEPAVKDEGRDKKKRKVC